MKLHSRDNCYLLDETEMEKLQHQIAVSALAAQPDIALGTVKRDSLVSAASQHHPGTAYRDDLVGLAIAKKDIAGLPSAAKCEVRLSTIDAHSRVSIVVGVQRH